MATETGIDETTEQVIGLFKLDKAGLESLLKGVLLSTIGVAALTLIMAIQAPVIVWHDVMIAVKTAALTNVVNFLRKYVFPYKS